MHLVPTLKYCMYIYVYQLLVHMIHREWRMFWKRVRGLGLQTQEPGGREGGGHAPQEKFETLILSEGLKF